MKIVETKLLLRSFIFVDVAIDQSIYTHNNLLSCENIC